MGNEGTQIGNCCELCDDGGGTVVGGGSGCGDGGGVITGGEFQRSYDALTP